MSDDHSTRNDGSESADPAAASDAAAEIAEIAEIGELAELHQQLAAAEDRFLRVQAEAQNMVRRAERDVDNARKFALERFAGALLPVLDNLERALAAMGEPTDVTRALGEGVELTLKSFSDVLQKFDVMAVEPVGQSLNPEFHQAMAMIEQPGTAPNSVVQVMQKGYTLNGRLLRPAMVVVAKPAPRIDETA